MGITLVSRKPRAHQVSFGRTRRTASRHIKLLSAGLPPTTLRKPSSLMRRSCGPVRCIEKLAAPTLSSAGLSRPESTADAGPKKVRQPRSVGRERGFVRTLPCVHPTLWTQNRVAAQGSRCLLASEERIHTMPIEATTKFVPPRCFHSSPVQHLSRAQKEFGQSGVRTSQRGAWPPRQKSPSRCLPRSQITFLKIRSEKVRYSEAKVKATNRWR